MASTIWIKSTSKISSFISIRTDGQDKNCKNRPQSSSTAMQIRHLSATADQFPPWMWKYAQNAIRWGWSLAVPRKHAENVKGASSAFPDVQTVASVSKLPMKQTKQFAGICCAPCVGFEVHPSVDSATGHTVGNIGSKKLLCTLQDRTGFSAGFVMQTTLWMMLINEHLDCWRLHKVETDRTWANLFCGCHGLVSAV